MMNSKILGVSAALVVYSLSAIPAQAAPGLGSEVYGATVEQGEVEAEARYGRLDDGPNAGEDTLNLELAWSPSDRLRLGTQLEFEREPGSSRKAEALGFEAIYTLGRVGGIDVAAYGEYEIVFDGTDAVETKLLFQRKAGAIDARLNLIAAKPLADGAKVELSYAASADVAVAGEVRAGLAAFGNLGTFTDFLPYEEHFAGPMVKAEVEGLGPELEIEAGYLFAFGKARDDANGQFRLILGMEF
jgi:hypothetical protein